METTMEKPVKHQEALGLHPHKCRACGKVFESRGGYVYKKPNGHGKYIYFCSWTCFRKEGK